MKFGFPTFCWPGRDAGGSEFDSLLQNLVAFWNFEESAAPFDDAVQPAASTPREWEIVTGSVSKAEGRPGEGVRFTNGGNSWLKLDRATTLTDNADLLFTTQDRTLAFWINLIDQSTSRRIMETDNNDAAIGWAILTDDTDATIVNFRSTDSGGSTDADFTTALTTGWQHLAFRFDRTNDTVEMIRNGSATGDTVALRPGDLDNGTTSYLLGRGTSSNNMVIDSLGYWDGLLSDYQIGLLYNGIPSL